MRQSSRQRNHRDVSKTMAAITEPITLEASIQTSDRIDPIQINYYGSQDYNSNQVMICCAGVCLCVAIELNYYCQ